MKAKDNPAFFFRELNNSFVVSVILAGYLFLPNKYKISPPPPLLPPTENTPQNLGCFNPLLSASRTTNLTYCATSNKLCENL